MCFQRKTVINQTGLGDEQYDALSTNQGNMGTQIEEGFVATGGKLDSISGDVAGIGTKVNNAANAVNTNTNTGFTNLTNLLDSYGDTLSQGQTDAAAGRKTYYDNMLTALQNNTGGLQTAIDTGFSDVGGRFDTVDQANTDIQTAVDTGFNDQATAFNNLEAGMNTQFDSQNDGLTTAFTELGGDLNTAFGNASDELNTVSSNVLEGQQGMNQSLDSLSANQDTYYGDLAQRAGTLQETTDGFQTNFDNFVNRYTDDTTLANQSRADIMTGQANTAENLSKGQSGLASRIGTLGEGTQAGFEVLSGAVEGGFSDSAASAQIERQNLSNRIGNVKTLLETTGATIDETSKAQYTALANSFDQNGELIASSIDDQGNTISRSIDEQGNIIQSTFDSTGTEIGRVSMDVETMLSNAENYQRSLSGQLQGLEQNVDTGFSDVASGQNQIEQTVETGQEGLMNATMDNRQLAEANALQTQQGFDSASQTMDTQLRDLARIASGQSDLDMRMRQDFKQIGDSFDDTGQLIQNTVSQNGTTISRAIDSNGNLLLRAFDMQGNRIGDKVLNINKSLFDLQNLKNMAGANTSMGNLSPAMQGNVPTGGFASPFTTTR
jgi:hypothetical protein